MKAKDRRNAIVKRLKESEAAVSASTLAHELSVSRQVIVGDIALIRASGHEISATPRGYIYEDKSETGFPYIGLVCCVHSPAETKDELYTIVDFGGCIIDVTVEHAIYGQLTGPLDIASRHDADLFLQHVENSRDAKPLSIVTGGVHFHKIGCKSEETFLLIKKALKEKGFLQSH